jgi:hypothetical protein
MAAKVPDDDLMLYAFAGVPDPIEPALEQLRRRASVCHDLRLRIVDDSPLRYPSWISGDVTPSQFVVHRGLDWCSCLETVVALADRQLEPAEALWRLHVFAPVTDVPRSPTPATVAVLQISHALADGTRTAELAGWLFGRPAPVAPIGAPRRGSLLLHSVEAARTHRQLMRDIDAGALPAPAPTRAPLLTNSAPVGQRRVRTVLRDRSALSGGTVTVSALVAISTALAGYLRDRGQDPAELAAEIPMANTGIRDAHNYFRNIGVGLHPDLPPAERANLIAAELSAGRRRGEHPAAVASRRSFSAVPAALLRWGVGKFDATARAPAVSGHTVVSSINRGAADLRFGDAPVLFSAGYPPLSPMMGLIHGVHGLGDTVAISVHAADSAGDVDDYVERLEHALG